MILINVVAAIVIGISSFAGFVAARVAHTEVIPGRKYTRLAMGIFGGICCIASVLAFDKRFQIVALSALFLTSLAWGIEQKDMKHALIGSVIVAVAALLLSLV